MAELNVTPNHGMLVIIKDRPEQTLATITDPHGNPIELVAPERHAARSITGTIVRVGPGCPEECQEGRRVIIGDFTGIGLEVDDVQYHVLSHSDVMAYLKEEQCA